MNTNRPHFYIIYTQGTARLLMGLVFTWLRYSKAELTLVSNGCDDDEKIQLQRLCDSTGRLHYLSLNTTKVLSHGEALNLLQSQNTRQDFGFIDSDVYAIGEFWPSLSDCMDEDVACHFIPVSASFRLPSEIEKLKNNRLGCSYFMRYNNQKLSLLRRTNDVHFDKRQWETLPQNIQLSLNNAGFKRAKYDTARLINAMFLIDDQQVIALSDESLKHLGGVSRISLQRQRRIRPLFESLISLIPVKSIRNTLINFVLDAKQSEPVASAAIAKGKKARKRSANHYYRELLMMLMERPGLVKTEDLPTLPIFDCPSINKNIAEITQELIGMFESLEPDQLLAISYVLNDG